MEYSTSLTRQQVQDILWDVYRKGIESKDLDVIDLVNEMKRNIASINTRSKEQQKLTIVNP